MNIISILLIEDNPADARIIKELLRETNSFKYELDIQDRLKSGLERLQNYRKDIVLLDLNLPDSNGQSTYESLQKLFPDIPVLLISGLGDEELSIKLIQLGAEDYLHKSNLNTSTIERSIRYSIERSNLRRSVKDELLKRMAAEAEIKKQNSILKAIFNSSHTIDIFLLDKNYQYLNFNKNHELRMKETGGIDLQPGMNFLDIISPPEIHAQVKRSIDMVLKGESFSEIQSLYVENKWYEIFWNAVFDGDEISGVACFVIDITARKQAEDEFVLLAYALESVNESVSITDMEGKILFVNTSFIKAHGYTDQELLGENLAIVRSKNNPEKLVQEILSATKQGKWQGELWNKRKNGSEFPIYLSATIINDKMGNPLGIIGVAADITEQKKMAINLSSAAEIAKLGYWEYNVTAGQFILNDQYYRIIQGSSTEKQGGNSMSSEEFLRRCVHPNDAKLVGENLRKAIESSDPDYLGNAEARVFTDGGEVVNVSVQFKPMKDFSGHTYKVYGVTQDITGRKHQMAELIVAKEKAEEMNKLKSTLLANMSHEMRTPLISILGYSEMIQEEGKNFSIIEMAKNINNGGTRLLTTLNNLLQFSKLESTTITPNIEKININQLLLGVIQNYTGRLEEKGLSLITNFASGPIYGYLDKVLLTDICNNLLHNAVAFTFKGSISISSEITNEFILIKITDTGVGIAKEKLAMIFEEFRQGSEGLSRSYEGSGLGLTIAKKFSRLLGGDITVESEVNVGSVFTMKFPNPHIHEDSVNEKDSSEGLSKTNSLADILYVEDDPHSFKIIKMFLGHIYKVDNAENGQEAIKKLNANNYDLFLMDINLGYDMNGKDVTRHIRTIPRYKNTPIIAITAHAMQDDRDEFLKAGCDNYLTKPFRKQDLIDMVKQALKKIRPPAIS